MFSCETEYGKVVRMDVWIGLREKQTRRKRRRDEHEGQYKKPFFLQLVKTDKSKKWAIS